MPTTIIYTSNGKIDPTSVVALTDLEARLLSGPSKVLLYLHGGLVDQASAEEMSKRLSSTGDAALNVPDQWEQIYIIWRTGVFETLKANWTDVFENDRLFKLVMKRLLSYFERRIGAGLVGRGVGDVAILSDEEISDRLIPGASRGFPEIEQRLLTSRADITAILDEGDAELQIAQDVELDDDFQHLAQDMEALLARKKGATRGATVGSSAKEGLKSFQRIDTDVRAELEAQSGGGAEARSASAILFTLAGHCVSIGKRVVRRIRSSRDHGMHATIAEEVVREFYGDLLGSIIWGMMVKDAGDHFLGGALGTRLVDILSTSQDPQIVVVGHSAGSIWATEFMNARARAGDDRPVDMVLLAPAVRTKIFAAMLDTSANSIRNFRLFAMKDELERADVLLGPRWSLIYPSSLLYLVSGLFEAGTDEAVNDAPLLGMDRFIGQPTPWLTEKDEIEALQKVKSFLNRSPNQVVLSISELGEGLNCGSRSHGGFDDDANTLVSVATYLR